MEQILEFKNRKEIRKWLEDNFEQKESIWIKLNKKEKEALKPGEALEEALCFGWIDSIIKRVDDTYYLKKFSKRRDKSNWSEYNKKLVGKLLKEGKMTGPGMHTVEVAKKNGSWDKKDDLPAITDQMMQELRNLLIGKGLVGGKFDDLILSMKKNYAMYYFSAKKEETRQNRLMRIIHSIENGPYLF